jgi:hypothetical protein
MSDPNKDWLQEELENLRDIEAPRTLLPSVMEKVRQRAARRGWKPLIETHVGLLRSFVLGLSLVILALLLVVNPTQFFSQVPGASALFNLVPLLLDATKTSLFQVKVFHFSLLAFLVPAIVLSYILLVATASAIQHLATDRK